MSDDTMPRRDFLKGAGAAGAAVATALGNSLSAPATGAQVALPPSPDTGTRAADLVLKNGKIVTVDTAFTIAQAIAITGDRIVAVGADVAMAAHTAPGTRVIDLKGKAVIPGLIDGHAHMDREGLKNIYPSLGRVRSIRDIQDRIAELARNTKPGEWIVTMPIGDPPFYFDVPDILAERRWPTRQELDVAAPNNPVLIRSIWGYWRSTPPLVPCANTEALKRAGITRDTEIAAGAAPRGHPATRSGRRGRKGGIGYGQRADLAVLADLGIRRPTCPRHGRARGARSGDHPRRGAAVRTVNGAYLTFDEDKKGSLEPGKLADLAVLSDDPLTIEEKSIADITSLMTIVGGRTVHQSPNWNE